VSKAAKQILFRFGCVYTFHIFSYLSICTASFSLCISTFRHCIETAAFDQTLRPKHETSWAKLAKEARDLFHPDFHNVSTATIRNSHATKYNKMQESIRKLKHSWGRFYGVSCFPAHPNLLVGEVSMNQTQELKDSDKVL
jgi:hypothetical protein